MSRGRTALALLALLGLTPGRAEACSVGENVPFEVDLAEAAVDHEAPDAIPAIEVIVGRGEGPDRSGCFGSGVSSCDDMGSLELAITPPDDDRTASTDLAYRVTLVEGSPPGRLGEEGQLVGVWQQSYDTKGLWF